MAHGIIVIIQLLIIMICPGEVFTDTKEFDTNIRQLLPYYDEMLSAIALCLSPDSQLILELGCGTGELTLQVLQQCPNAQVVAVDYSPRMMTVIQDKLNVHGKQEQVQLRQLDFGAWANEQVGNDIGDHFDAIISSLAIHHLSDEMKGQLFHKIARSLKPNGSFWNADPLLAEFSELSEIYEQSRQRWAQQQGLDLDHVRAKIGQSETYGYSRYDQLATLDTHFQLLQQAGFSKTAVIWKYYNLGVFGGLR